MQYINSQKILTMSTNKSPKKSIHYVICKIIILHIRKNYLNFLKHLFCQLATTKIVTNLKSIFVKKKDNFRVTSQFDYHESCLEGLHELVFTVH